MVFRMYSNESEIHAAAALIRAGRVVVFPTETVYGVGANALDPEAVARIFLIQGRPTDNPLIVHLSGAAEIGLVASEVSPIAHRLLEVFAPGPLTIVLPARADLPRVVTAGLDTVAVRVPSHPVAHALLAASAVPVAAPSANRSGEPSPTRVEMARRSLRDGPDAYLDGGPCEVGLESTVLAVFHDEIRILRPGAVTEADILSVLPDAAVRSGPVSEFAHPDRPAPSPGMRHRHYQPNAGVRLWETPQELREEILRCCEGGVRAGIIIPAAAVLPSSLDETPAGHRARGEDGSGPVVRTYRDVREYARQLYAWFWEFDEAGVAMILAHVPGGEGLGAAIRDRLWRASG